MGRHFNILIWIFMLKTTKEQVLFDDLEDRQQNSLNTAMSFIKNEQQSMEKILFQKLEEIEKNLQAKINTKIENVTKNIVENFTKILEYKLADSDCDDILKRYPNKRGNDGVYNIMDVSDKIRAVYCDMTTDNGGWTVIQRRVNGSVDFNRNWTEYKNGFGRADHEYWIGNDLLHRLTSLKPQELRVNMERFNGENAYAVYSNFSVGDETSKYKLEVNGYSGNAGDSLDSHNNMKFSTPDQDNDNSSGNCATSWRSGWWFNKCYHTNPNGQYTDSEKIGDNYTSWYHWKNSWISLKSIELMIRPRF